MERTLALTLFMPKRQRGVILLDFALVKHYTVRLDGCDGLYRSLSFASFEDMLFDLEFSFASCMLVAG